VREAGGTVSEPEGGPNYMKSGSIACGNEHMHRELLAMLASARLPG